MNVYVIDDATRTPIANASVTVGTVTGSTDTTGLFVANGLVGKQDVFVSASGYRGEAWVGANGANMTLDVQTSTAPTPASGTFSGSIDLSTFTVAAGHNKVAVVVYSQDDKFGDAANNITTPSQGNICFVGGIAVNQTCNYTVVTRTGAVALLAAILDADAQNNLTLIGWAAKTDLTAVSGTTQSGTVLDVIAASDLSNETVDFGTPPSGLANVAAIVGVDLGAQGVMQVPIVASPTSATVLVPKLSVFASATYRLTGVAKQGTTDPTPESITLQRGLTSATLSAGTWLDPPTNITATHQMASWTASPGALAHGVEYLQGTTHLINITAFDGSTTVQIPSGQTLPSSGMTVTATALGGTLDLTNFSIDNDRAKITGASSSPGQVN